MSEKVISIIPVWEMDDPKRVSDSGSVNLNEITLGVFHQLNLYRGTISDFCESTFGEKILLLYFNSHIQPILDSINKNIREYTTNGVTISFVHDKTLDKYTEIHITIDNVPELEMIADIVADNNNVKVVKPRIVQV